MDKEHSLNKTSHLCYILNLYGLGYKFGDLLIYMLKG